MLIFLTLFAWGIHAGLVTVYSNVFSSTKLISFRILHTAEIGLMIAIVMLTYYSLTNESLSVLATLTTVLGTLLAIDLVVLLLSPSVREKFDAIHFVTAYISTIGVILLTYKFRA